MKRPFGILSILFVCASPLLAQLMPSDAGAGAQTQSHASQTSLLRRLDAQLEELKYSLLSVMEAIRKNDEAALDHIFTLRPDLVNQRDAIQTAEGKNPPICWTLRVSRTKEKNEKLASVFIKHGFQQMDLKCVDFSDSNKTYPVSEQMLRSGVFCPLFKEYPRFASIKYIVTHDENHYIVSSPCLGEVMKVYPQVIPIAAEHADRYGDRYVKIRDIQAVKPVVQYLVKKGSDPYLSNSFAKLVMEYSVTTEDDSVVNIFRPKWIALDAWNVLLKHAKQDNNSFAYAALLYFVNEANMDAEASSQLRFMGSIYTDTFTKKGGFEIPMDKQDFEMIKKQVAIAEQIKKEEKQKKEQEERARQEQEWLDKFEGNVQLAALFKDFRGKQVFFYPKGAKVSFEERTLENGTDGAPIVQEFIVPVVMIVGQGHQDDHPNHPLIVLTIDMYNEKGKKFWGHLESGDAKVAVQPKDDKNQRLSWNVRGKSWYY